MAQRNKEMAVRPKIMPGISGRAVLKKPTVEENFEMRASTTVNAEKGREAKNVSLGSGYLIEKFPIIHHRKFTKGFNLIWLIIRRNW